MSIDMQAFEAQFPVVIPGYSAGYTEASLDPHWACDSVNPNCPTGEHAVKAHPALDWLAVKADLICAIAIATVLIVVLGVLPIFI